MINDNVNLYINRYGYIFPSCKTYKEKPIAHLKDINCSEIVNDFFGRVVLNSITVEFSSLCHANCFYCFQHDGKCNKYEYFNELEKFLLNTKTQRLFVSGGEILDQEDTMKYLLTLKPKLKNTIFHLKSNGNSNLDKLEFVEKVFDQVVITFNGFSRDSCNYIMGKNIDIEKTKTFVETLVKRTKVRVGIKYLLSPMVLGEMNSFYKWALALKPRCIILQTAYNYRLFDNGLSVREGTTFDACNDLYWSKIIEIIAKDFKTVINSFETNNIFNFLAADKEAMEILKLDKETALKFRTDGVYDLEG